MCIPYATEREFQTKLLFDIENCKMHRKSECDKKSDSPIFNLIIGTMLKNLSSV